MRETPPSFRLKKIGKIMKALDGVTPSEFAFILKAMHEEVMCIDMVVRCPKGHCHSFSFGSANENGDGLDIWLEDDTELADLCGGTSAS